MINRNTILIDTIKANPVNPRIFPDKKVQQLIESILEFPEMLSLRPIVYDELGHSLGGNMRLTALKEISVNKDKAIEHLNKVGKPQNYELFFQTLCEEKRIPKSWVCAASGLTEDQKKEFIIKDNVGFGEWDFNMLNSVEWSSHDLAGWGLELPSFVLEDEAPKVDDVYTRKIESPIYEPSEEKPDIKTLVDVSKVQTLLQQIDNSNLPESEKGFLKLAAHRHSVFNYSKIADFYAHSSKECQELMENSALVIIDFNKAIDEGYVRLTAEIADQYGDEPDGQE